MLQPSTPELFYYPYTTSLYTASYLHPQAQASTTQSLSTCYIQVRKDAGAWRIERHPCCRPRSFRRLRTGHPAEQPPRGAGYGIRCQSALRRQQDAFSPTPFVAAVNPPGLRSSATRTSTRDTYGLIRRLETWPVAASAPRPLRPGAAGPAPGPAALLAARASRHTALLCSHTYNTRLPFDTPSSNGYPNTIESSIERARRVANAESHMANHSSHCVRPEFIISHY